MDEKDPLWDQAAQARAQSQAQSDSDSDNNDNNVGDGVYADTGTGTGGVREVAVEGEQDEQEQEMKSSSIPVAAVAVNAFEDSDAASDILHVPDEDYYDQAIDIDTMSKLDHYVDKNKTSTWDTSNRNKMSMSTPITIPPASKSGQNWNKKFSYPAEEEGVEVDDGDVMQEVKVELGGNTNEQVQVEDNPGKGQRGSVERNSGADSSVDESVDEDAETDTEVDASVEEDMMDCDADVNTNAETTEKEFMDVDSTTNPNRNFSDNGDNIDNCDDGISHENEDEDVSIHNDDGNSVNDTNSHRSKGGDDNANDDDDDDDDNDSDGDTGIPLTLQEKDQIQKKGDSSIPTGPSDTVNAKRVVDHDPLKEEAAEEAQIPNALIEDKDKAVEVVENNEGGDEFGGTKTTGDENNSNSNNPLDGGRSQPNEEIALTDPGEGPWKEEICQEDDLNPDPEQENNDNLPTFNENDELKKESKKRGRGAHGNIRLNIEEGEFDKVADDKILLGRRSSKRTKLTTEKSEKENASLDESNERKQQQFPTVESLINECVLLHAAIHNPLRVLKDGPGLWMLDELLHGLRNKARFQITDDKISFKWRNMLLNINNDKENDDDNNAPSPCQHLIKDVLTICFASKSAEAQCVALLTAGWRFIPVDKSQRRRKTKLVVSAIYNTGEWAKDGTPMPLNDAWDDHINDLCDEIDQEFEKLKDELTEIVTTVTTAPVKTKSVPKPKQESKFTFSSKKAEAKKKSKAGNKNTTTIEEPVEMKQDTKDSVTPEISTGPVSLESIIKSNRLSIDQFPKSVRAFINQRQGYVKKHDPRPVLQCTWCSPKLPARYNLQVEAICEACMFLYEEGWRCEKGEYCTGGNTVPTTRYFNKEGKKITSVKLYLELTTSLVAKKFGGYDEDEIAKDTKQSADSINDADVQDSNDIENCTPSEEEDDDDNNTLNSNAIKILADLKKNGLPKLRHLLLCPRGLAGVLHDDRFCLLNLCYGSDMAVAFQVLNPIITGLPSDQIMNETPFLRPGETINPTQSRYFGVIKAGADKEDFAIEFPILDIEKCSEVPFCLPKCCTTGDGKMVILRAGIENEYCAGQYYAFIIRILYGNQSIKSIHEASSSEKALA